jgi:ABC-type antimicrobial peptide transport system permease subunit
MLRNYFKIAWRNLVKRKVFTAINILGLSIGVASCTLIFLFISHHLSYDNFHNNSDRIYRVVTEEHRDIVDYMAAPPPGFANVFKNDYPYVEKVAKIVSLEDNLITINNTSKKFKETVVFAEPDFFEILNFPLIESLGPNTLDEPNTAYITEKFSKKIFGKDNALGKTFVLGNKETIQVIGILKDLPTTSLIKGHVFPSFKTLKHYNWFLSSERWGGASDALNCFALLHPNQNISQIESELAELPKKYRPNSKNIHHYKLQPIQDAHFDANYGGSINADLLWIFALIGFFIIGVACINFINISSAQSFVRSKEIGIRKVLGSYKHHLFWQFITETFIISLFAVLLGIGLGLLALPSLNNLLDLNLSIERLLDFKTIGFVFLLLIAISLVSGSYPGILLARIAPVLALKGKLTSRDAGGQATRKILLTTQFTISIVLIIATVIMAKQINYAVKADLGFDKESIVMVEIPGELERVKLEGLKNRMKQVLGVQDISTCYSSPGAAENNWGTNIRYDNRPDDEEFSINAKFADEDYLNTFGLKLLAGRNFRVSDSIREVVVNEALANKLGLTSIEDLLEKKIEVNGGNMKVSIVGVVANFHDQSFHVAINPVIIAPQSKSYAHFAIKINGGNTKKTLDGITQQWEAMFPNYIYAHTFMDDRVAMQYGDEERLLSLSKIFSGFTIFISCLGLYGMISFFVAQRRKEIGVRKVLGSKVVNILALFTLDFFKLIGIAGLVASPMAWYFMNDWLEGYQYRTTINWWVFAIAIGGIALITVVTISYQTVKVAIANPIKTLRTE